MAEKLQTGKQSIKHSIITKDNQKILMATGFAAFVVTFSLVGSSILYQQMNYQNRVIDNGKEALANAEESLENTESLTKAYTKFDNESTNKLGGNSLGEGELDGKNSKIVLDALPATYNFPALTTSVEKIVEMSGLKFVSMAGTDDEIAQKINASSTTPIPIEMPFEVEVKGTYNASLAFVDALHKSIRPFQVTSIEIKADGDRGAVITKINAKTFFQPTKSLNLIEEKVQ